MKTTLLRIGVLTGLCLTLLAGAAFAGAEYTLTATNLTTGKTDTTVIKSEGLNLWIGMAKVDRKDMGGALIFQGERPDNKPPRVIILDEEGGHMILTHAKIDALLEMMPSTSGQEQQPFMNEQMLEMARQRAESIQDPETRARALEQLDKMTGGDAGAEGSGTEWVEKGLREKQGYPSVRYDGLRGGVKFAEAWATDWHNLPGGRGTGKAFEAFGDFWEGMTERFSKASGMHFNMLATDDNPFQNIFELGRFPVASDEWKDGEKVRSYALTDAKRVDHDPSVFKPGSDSVERKFGM